MRVLSNTRRKLGALEGYELSVTKWLPLEIPQVRFDTPLIDDKTKEARTRFERAVTLRVFEKLCWC